MCVAHTASCIIADCVSDVVAAAAAAAAVVQYISRSSWQLNDGVVAISRCVSVDRDVGV